MKKLLSIVGCAFVVFVVGGIVLGAMSGTGASKEASRAKAMADALAPEKTAKRIEAGYRKRGVAGHVTCVDFSATEQRCKVTRNGRVVMRLDATIDMATGNVDVRPAS